jgi:hypothetical protein
VDFSTTFDAPFPVTLRDGKTYQLPRFLNPEFKEWAALIKKERVAEILAQFSTPQERAQHLTWWEPPIQDTASLVRRARGPEGQDYVIGKCMEMAGVPEEERKHLLKYADPIQMQYLAEQLTMSNAVAAALRAEGPVRDMPAGESASSLQPSTSESSSTSDGSRTTGAATNPGSDTATTSTPTPSVSPAT